MTYRLELTLQQSSTAGLSGYSLSGEGQLVGDDTSWTIQRSSGTFTKPDVSLSLGFEDARPAQLEGTVGDDFQTIEAEVVGGPVSFDTAPVTLNRQ